MINDGGRFRAIDTLKVTAFYAALTILFAYPLSIRPGELLFGDNTDTHLFIWTLAWDAHAFLHHPLAIFDANIYYPYPRTLAFSENMIGLALFSAPLQWLTGNPVLAMNVASLAASTLCGTGAFLLARRLGLGVRAAIVCGLVFGFSPARFLRTGQLHVGAVQWMPFTLASLHAYLENGGKWPLRLAALFFSLQALTSGHGAVFLTVAVAGLIAYRVILGEPPAVWQRVRDFGIVGAVLFAPTLLVYLPYRRVATEMGFRRGYLAWEPTPESFLATRTHLEGWLLSWTAWPDAIDTASAYFFPGWLPLLLAAFALITHAWLRERRAVAVVAPAPEPRPWPALAATLLEIAALANVLIAILVAAGGPIRWTAGTMVLFSARSAGRPLLLAGVAAVLWLALGRAVPFSPRGRSGQWQARWARWQQRAAGWRRDPTAFYALLTFGTILILLGPPLGIWPHIFWMPGFNLIRAPGRFIVLTVLAIAVLAAIGFDRIARRLTPRGQNWLTAGTGVLMTIEFAGMPLPAFPIDVRPPVVDRWLAAQPEPFAVAEFPVVPSARSQTIFMLHSMAHWQKTVHGYSGYQAEMHTLLYRELRGFPDDLSCRRLRELNVRYAVVHAELYPQGEWAEVEKRLLLFADQLTLEYSAGTGRVYSVRSQP